MPLLCSKSNGKQSPIKPLIEKVLKPNPLVCSIVVIMGKTGVGKTTLFNKICNTRRDAGAGVSSVTKDICLSPVGCGRYPFEIVDTPGNDAPNKNLRKFVKLLMGYAQTLSHILNKVTTMKSLI